jgi:hypothetical protein
MDAPTLLAKMMEYRCTIFRMRMTIGQRHKKRRKRWVDFVKRKRLNFKPTASSKICSRHFMAEDFVRPFAVGLTTEKPKLKQLLKTDNFGICAYPTILVLGGDEMKPLLARDRRHSVSNAFSNYVFTIASRQFFRSM